MHQLTHQTQATMAITNFPNKGDDKKISLRNSEEPQFSHSYAKKLKAEYPKIWKTGGNIRGNEAYQLWTKARNGDDTPAIREWIKERESWIKRHYRDGQKFKKDTEPNLSNVAGVVAQIKWGTIGNLGQSKMKSVINELKAKLDKKKNRNMEQDEIKEIQQRHIQKVEETDDAYIIYYGKAMDEKEEIEEIVEDIKEPNDEAPVEDNYKEDEERKSVEFEKRMTKSDIQMRDEKSNTVIGYAAVFNALSENLGGFRETINKRAFDGRLEDDVRFLINHDGMPLGRTTAGTLRLSVDENGLKYEVDLPDTPTANELRVALERQEITQSSFQFTVEEDSWEERDGQMYREINKVGRLLDVAAVTFPAYPDATVALRKMENYRNAQKEKIQYKAEEKDLHYRSIRELKIKLLNQIKPNEIS